MSKRLVLLIMGLVVAYFAIYMGDGVYTQFATATTENGAFGWGTLLGIGGIVGLILGVISGGIFLLGNLGGAKPEFEGQPEVYATSSAIVIGYAFGSFAGPFTNYGPYPWYWASRWDFLMILALVPAVIVLRDIIADANIIRRTRKAALVAAKESERKVVPLGRQ